MSAVQTHMNLREIHSDLIPVALGHEGTGEIVKMGKNVKVDTAGKALKVGDKVVTCMIFKDDPDIEMFDLNKKNIGGADVYGLLPDDDVHLNGWFSGLHLDQRRKLRLHSST